MSASPIEPPFTPSTDALLANNDVYARDFHDGDLAVRQDGDGQARQSGP